MKNFLLLDSRYGWLLFVGCLAFANAWGDALDTQSNAVDCNFPKDYQQNLPTHLLDLQNLAMAAGSETCKNLIGLTAQENAARDESLRAFAKQAKAEFDKLFPDSVFANISTLSGEWQKQVANHQHDYRNFSAIEDRKIVGPPMGAMTHWSLKLPSQEWGQYTYEVTQAVEDRCAAIVETAGVAAGSGKDCTYAFDLWENAVVPFQYHYTDLILKDNGKKLQRLQDQWAAFIDEARYQTPLDVWLTTRWYHQDFRSNRLSGPPPAQLFLLHPTLIYEHLPDAEKGNREDISLAIEWGGVNWWRKGIGFSVASAYKDRKDQPSVGYGLMIHAKNKYSFGYLKRNNGDDSYFVNIDLMEWFGDKKGKYEKYKKYF